MKNKDNFKNILHYFPSDYQFHLKNFLPAIQKFITEIRIRVNCPLQLCCGSENYFLTNHGFEKNFYSSNNKLNSTFEDISKIFKAMCEYSVYSFEDQIKNGFITIPGGHRIGICGQGIYENNHLKNIKNMTSLNIRIAKEVKGCCQKIFDEIVNSHFGTIIVGPPACGKTTLIRDIARTISTSTDHNFPKVVIIDERMEIASAFCGVPQLDVGLSDVLCNFKKSSGILQAIRCLAPNIIICDEIGDLDEIKSIKVALNCGVKIICTIHAYDENDFFNKSQIPKLLETQAFEKIIFLKNANIPGQISKIRKVCELK